MFQGIKLKYNCSYYIDISIWITMKKSKTRIDVQNSIANASLQQSLVASSTLCSQVWRIMIEICDTIHVVQEL